MAFDAKTGEYYDINNLRDKIDNACKKLEISEKIIEGNLIKEIVDYLENQ